MLKDRLKTARINAGLTQEQLAERAKVTQTTIYKIEDGQRDRPRKIREYAKILGVSPQWLEYGEEAKISEPKPQYISGNRVIRLPLINSVAAGDWQYQVESQDIEYRKTTANVSPHSFYTRVSGSSMMNVKDARSIPPGAFVLVDTKVEESNGSIVIATLEESGDTTCKELVIDGNNKYLMPLNPDYKPVIMTGTCRIIGVVVRAEVDYL